MSKRLSKLAAAVPGTDAEVEALISATLKTQTERETLVAERDSELQKLREEALKKERELEAARKFNANIGAKDVLLARNLELLETWAALNKKKRFGKAKSILMATARVGWRLGNWKTKLRSKVKWADVIESLQDIVDRGRKEDASEKAKARAALAEEYIRYTIEADKEAMLRDRAERKSRALLKTTGVVFDQNEIFFVAPDREGQQPSTLVAS